jgi:hypothetical protein
VRVESVAALDAPVKLHESHPAAPAPVGP